MYLCLHSSGPELQFTVRIFKNIFKEHLSNLSMENYDDFSTCDVKQKHNGLSESSVEFQVSVIREILKPTKSNQFQRVYADVLANKPATYYEYDNFCPHKLGHGKYSIVFEGIPKRRMKRVIVLEEELILLNYWLLLTCRNTAHTALVFEHEADARYYLYEVIRALDYCHSRGIMHRDVKPHNIMVDLENSKLRLIDWGLAEFYHPGQEYNVRVASRYFKGPELLVDYGTPELIAYMKKYNITIDEDFKPYLGCTRKSWQRFVHTEHEYLITDQALHLLESLLRIDHMEKLLQREALNHKYFSSIT
ncbi:hypothetical protein NQ317_016692 [Molorchus minor]|uniref:non-specific serine/threonine protein kinase n=1 Tax=Molorchus minor TaxID=1323400 RepID=A0ABQ9IZ01_9CUCU|nr:hypothetical protein NQ317_016692 [Molorchus minor]